MTLSCDDEGRPFRRVAALVGAGGAGGATALGLAALGKAIEQAQREHEEEMVRTYASNTLANLQSAEDLAQRRARPYDVGRIQQACAERTGVATDPMRITPKIPQRGK